MADGEFALVAVACEEGLLHEGALLEELGEAALSDLLKHVLWLALVASHLLAYFELVVDGLLGDAALVDSDRSHGSDLHSNLLASLGVDGLVEADDSSDLLVVDVASDGLGVDLLISGEVDFFADDAGELVDILGNGVAVEFEGLEGLKVCGLSADGEVEDGSGEGEELVVCGDEVGLGIEDDGSCVLAVFGNFSNCYSVFSLAVCALSSDELTSPLRDRHPASSDGRRKSLHPLSRTGRRGCSVRVPLSCPRLPPQ